MKVLNSRTTTIVARERVMAEVVDLALINKILRYIYDKGDSVTVSELVDKIGMSYTTASKYVAIMESNSLVKVSTKGKKKMIEITDKGLEYLMLYARLVNLLKS